MGIPTVQYIGQELGLSPYYSSDLFKRETGKIALEFIHLFLIEKAKILISENHLSITQIAYDLGFEYPQHFSKFSSLEWEYLRECLKPPHRYGFEDKKQNC